jgi:carbamoyl-phosphate synthase/aspartate carbamoyltransferase/dihydroorotase
MSTNPRKIYNLPEQSDTYIEVDPDTKYTIANADLQSKCGWTPFDGWEVTGRVQRVFLRGQVVYDVLQPGVAGRILAKPGSGQVIPKRGT